MSSTSTARRLQALESYLVPHVERISIIVRFDEPEITGLRCLAGGREWKRRPDELEAGFISRARAEASQPHDALVLVSI